MVNKYIETMCVNLTPHVIVIKTATGDVVLPPSGTIARMEMEEVEIGSIGGVPIISTKHKGIIGLPSSTVMSEILDDQGHAQTVPLIRTQTYIVSSLVLDSYSGPLHLVAPDTGATAIRDHGQVVAVTRLRGRSKWLEMEEESE